MDPGQKPNQNRRELSAAAALCPPDRQTGRFPNPWDFRKRRPDRLGTRFAPSERLRRQEASFSLCKALGSFLFPCILLAILYPVWEFQKHLHLSSVQPHMCRLKGSVMLLPATEEPGHHPCRMAPTLSYRDQVLHGWMARDSLDRRVSWHFPSPITTQTTSAQHPQLALCGEGRRDWKGLGRATHGISRQGTLQLPLW